MKGRHDADFSHSLTDLMSGLAVMFLLIAAIFVVQSAQARKAVEHSLEQLRAASKDKERDAEELAKLRRINSKSIEKLVSLRDRLGENEVLREKIVVDYDQRKDPLLLTIRFTDEKLRFPKGRCAVGDKQERDLRKTLSELFPELCKTIASSPDVSVAHTITLEGHTDRSSASGSECGMTPNPRESFENNVRLSAARAQYVFFLARNVLRDEADTARCLEDNFVVAGRGETDLLDPTHPYGAENRRVEIKVRVAAARAEAP